MAGLVIFGRGLNGTLYNNGQVSAGSTSWTGWQNLPNPDAVKQELNPAMPYREFVYFGDRVVATEQGMFLLADIS